MITSSGYWALLVFFVYFGSISAKPRDLTAIEKWNLERADKWNSERDEKRNPERGEKRNPDGGEKRNPERGEKRNPDESEKWNPEQGGNLELGETRQPERSKKRNQDQGAKSNQERGVSGEDKLNRELQRESDSSYQAYLLYSIPAVSAGKNLFRMSYGPTEDCVRTAKAILQLAANPSTSQKAFYVMHESVAKAAEGKSSAFFQRHVNTTCYNINEEVRKLSSDFPNFGELKRNVTFSRPTNNYIFEVPSNRTFNNFTNSANMTYDDAEMFKFETVLQFQALTIAPATDRSPQDVVAVVRAVDRLARERDFSSMVNRVFTKALEDHTDAHRQKRDKYDATRASAFTKKVDQYFVNDSVLKLEYQKVKKQVIEEIQRVRSY